MAVTSSGTATVTLPTDEQILITREFDAPKHLVYKAFTTPELVKRWWHANRGEVTIAEIDLRVGGTWRYVSVTTDGFEAGFHGEYREIVPNHRHPRRRRARSAEHAHARRGGRADDPHGSRGAPDEGRARRAYQLRYGGRHAGRLGPPGAGRDLA